MKKLFVFVLLYLLVGCQTTYRDRYTVMQYDNTLLTQYEVPPPPVAAIDYSKLLWSEKESLWIDYTGSLIGIIGKHQADKNGLKKAQSEFQLQIEQLNKKE